MATIRAHIFIAVLWFSAAVSAQTPHADDAQAPSSAEPESTFLGIPLRTFRTYPVPFDKTYDALTAEERRLFRSQFPDLAEDDEPPYPVDGLKALFSPISNGLTRLHRRRSLNGPFEAMVEVDAEGDPKAIKIVKSSDRAISLVVADVALSVKYKPARCRGVPCAMGFPVRMQFRGY